ncbi:NAD(P)-dependent oxidoreductase [Polaromonas sp. JS666]|uniref:NAD(P)-dependent oxidoreductase n=1 Tax=Polaromonas sp. (strain JS666 / ATCC BAA-500) TaxID=296591 RepID=UPI00005315B2|nr:NAD(P)-dependent oxidoreductase [Polaromonas sp. JS666]ABE42160.1 6-phosphogluconate dehydrogenase, NAD-binding protein [Polaromonas sp. JS666]
MKHIGMIGASGLMGHGIARNLQAKGFDLSLTVHRNTERVADLLAAGAKQVASPAGLGDCDAVIICVTGSPQVEQTLSGPDGVLSRALAGLIVIDTSTSEPESTRRLAALCAERGVTLVDAPLARTPVEAELGRLNTMVGAEQAVFDKIRPVLAAYCENIFHVGGPGAGHVIKLLNNFIGQAICTATAEAFAVGALAGINPQKLVEVISAGAVNSGLFQAMAKTLNGDFTGLKFELDNARKDLRYYTHLAEMVNVPSLVGEAVHQSLATASALGQGKKFVPALVTAQEKLTGAKIAPQ